MFAFRSFGTLLGSGTVLCSDEAIDPSHYHRQIEGKLINFQQDFKLIFSYNIRGYKYEEMLPACRHFSKNKNLSGLFNLLDPSSQHFHIAMTSH